MAPRRGRQEPFGDNNGGLVVRGDRKEMSTGCSFPADTDFEAHLRGLIGFDCDLQIAHVNTWRPHLLMAEKFRVGRVFMAGEAVHLLIPTRGPGMNTRIGGAPDLSSKPARVLKRWGGGEGAFGGGTSNGAGG